MLLLPKFDYEEPKSLPEALRVLAELRGAARVVAGGTDLLVNMKRKTIAPGCLVSLKKIDALRQIDAKRTAVEIGSHVTVSELAVSDLIVKMFPVLAASASSLGSPLIRNRATIGGNIVTARPAADLPPALMVLGAEVELKGRGRKRKVALDDFFTGPGTSVISDEEVLTKVIIGKAPPHTGSAYLKLGHRNALEIAIVAVASRITLDRPDGVITDARIVLSSVAPKAVHARSAEACLLGQKASAELFALAAAAAIDDCSPIDDMRGGAAYRSAMVETFTKRTLLRAYDGAKGIA